MLYHFLPMQVSQQQQKPSEAGFSLIELVVTISIMVIVSGVILARHSAFTGASLLRSQAYEIALKVREVQLSAISSSELGAGFRNVYGVHFNTTRGNVYSVFRDADSDYFYDSTELFGVQGIVDGRFVIDEIRLIGGAGGTVDQISVLFERPNFDAKLYTGSGAAVAATVSGIEIDVRVKGTTGDTVSEKRVIEITKTGQIAVQSS